MFDEPFNKENYFKNRIPEKKEKGIKINESKLKKRQFTFFLIK